MSTRKEMILPAVGLLIVAALILYRSLALPDDAVRTVPQTAAQTADETDFSRSRYAVNVNEAGYEELMGVHGMTDAAARGILAYRAEIGRFYTTDELLDVPGVGKKTLEKLLPYICLEEE